MIKISPSILSCNFADMGNDCLKMVKTGAEMLHIDVMDGHFVPNISFGVPIIKALRPLTETIFDVHLMISEPHKYVEDFINAGADIITFHLESDSDVLDTIRTIKNADVKVGLSIKPATPAEKLIPYLPYIDMALVMTVEPGFGGQKFMGDMMRKVKMLRSTVEKLELEVDIQVDGGINAETGAIAVQNGANILVAGSYLFGAEDYNQKVKELREAVEASL